MTPSLLEYQLHAQQSRLQAAKPLPCCIRPVPRALSTRSCSHAGTRQHGAVPARPPGWPGAGADTARPPATREAHGWRCLREHILCSTSGRTAALLYGATLGNVPAASVRARGAPLVSNGDRHHRDGLRQSAPKAGTVSWLGIRQREAKRGPGQNKVLGAPLNPTGNLHRYLCCSQCTKVLLNVTHKRFLLLHRWNTHTQSQAYKLLA